MAGLSPDEFSYQKTHIHQDQGPKIIGISTFLVILTSVAVVSRFIARRSRNMRYGWDDWLCVPALILIIGMCALNVISIPFGLGKHLLATDPAKTYKILQIGWILSLFYTLSHFFIKMAILSCYIRIFTLNIRWFKYTVYTMMFYVSAWTISLFVVELTKCRPISYFWESRNISRRLPAVGRCTNNNDLAIISTAALNTVGDIALLVLPITVLWRLNFSKKTKLGVIGIFCFGIFACIASMLRLIYTVKLFEHTIDITWHMVNLYLWTSIEAAIGILCACFPVIGPLLATLGRNVIALVGKPGEDSTSMDMSKIPDGSRYSNIRRWPKSKQEPEKLLDFVYPLNAKNGGSARTDEYIVYTSLKTSPV
ncbi:hypothetical protein M501DRAFT_979939 [Patellaria atrata CBS 101060]|uniref:Rhodopsin domain-containing protein n=1 Tax=Patellaria atrata CBS 101060 TaxID=1346257 RepID=A0A9P4S7H7_9PEZI|nr:hypothetical protein M501DRAFT_979939 [Patellaria atrata CBS 101060]